MYVEQRLQQLNEIYGADAEDLLPGLRTLVQDGQRVSVPTVLMDGLGQLVQAVLADGLINRSLSLSDARAAAASAREEAGKRLADAWRHPPSPWLPPAPQGPVKQRKPRFGGALMKDARAGPDARGGSRRRRTPPDRSCGRTPAPGAARSGPLNCSRSPMMAFYGVFGRMAHVKDGRHGRQVVINEHALHALQDFCSEVYDAWAKYQIRLAETETSYRGSVF
jgi:hypothetical protein